MRKKNFGSGCVTAVERLADEDLGRVVCHHYRGNVDMDKYIASVDWPGPDLEDPDRVARVIRDLKQADVTLEFWADQEGGLIRRIVEDWDLHPEGDRIVVSRAVPVVQAGGEHDEEQFVVVLNFLNIISFWSRGPV